LEPKQTEGKKHPYVYSLCEALACRSFAPLQDTPAYKLTWEAKVQV